MSKTSGRRVLTAVVMMLSYFAGAHAQDFPTKPVELIVPWTPGGGSDILMRMVVEAASEHLGQPMIVVNKPGAAGSIGLREVASAPANGYKLGMIATGFLALQYGSINAPALGEFDVIAYVGTDPSALAATAASGWKTIDQFLGAAREAPGKIRNANDPPVGSNYLAISLMMRALDVKLTLISYPGSAQINQALLGGEVQTGSVTVPDVAEYHGAGRMHLLAVAGEERHPLASDVPTLKELGFPLVIGTSRAIVAPRGLDPAVLAKLEGAVLAGLNSKAFRSRAERAGFSIAPRGSAEGTAFLKELDAALYPVLVDAGMVKVRQK